jgi:hypothetical protein
MSWDSLYLIENTIKFPSKKEAKKIEKIIQIEIGNYENLEIDNLALFIDPDYIDRYFTSNVLKSLAKNKAIGFMYFGDLSFNARFWGYSFDGKGNYKELDGNLVWKEK